MVVKSRRKSRRIRTTRDATSRPLASDRAACTRQTHKPRSAEPRVNSAKNQQNGRLASVPRSVTLSHMTAADFRRIALSLDGVEEGSHMGAVDFRVGGRIFATLASVKDGFGNLMLTPEIQADFVAEEPDLFVPVAGGWGRMGATHIRLAKANRDILTGALQAAWKLRVDKNAATRAGGRTRKRR